MQSELKYRNKIEKLKTDLAKYSHKSLIEATLNSLISKKTEEIEFIKKLPWIQLFLLKLALIGPSGKREITAKEYNHHANRLYNLQHLAADLEMGDLELKLRPMLLQQLWYQQSQSALLSIIRQSMFFAKPDSWYSEQFMKKTNLSLKNFYKITIYIFTIADKSTSTASELNLPQLIHFLSPAIPAHEILAYFRLTAIKTGELPYYFKKHELRDIYTSEYFQDTPLKSKPIIINGNELFIPNATLLKMGLSELAPEILKGIPGYKDKFGKDFESYIHTLLIETKAQILCEQEIKKLFPPHYKNAKVSDILIYDKDNALFIECKAIEPSPVVRTCSDPETLRKNLENSFIKAISQGFSTAHAISTSEIISQKTCALLIVTHQDFGIFNGKYVASHIDKNLESNLTKEFPESPISLDRSIYCTIDDLERLCRGHNAGLFNLFELVNTAAFEQDDAATRKMAFSQCISKYYNKKIDLNLLTKKEIDTYLLETKENYLINRKYWKNKINVLLSSTTEISRALNNPLFHKTNI